MKTGLFLLNCLLAACVVLFAACDDDDGSDTDAGTDGGGDTDTDTDTDADFECTEDDNWWIWDLSVMPPEDVQICAHVRGTGENVYVLVEFDAWGNTVDQEDVDALVAAWDSATPSDSSSGIFSQVTGLFGDPPDKFDDDDRIYLFLYEMEGYAGNSFDGYFKVDDQGTGANSNMHEMLHLNTLNNAPSENYMLSVQAHEFQHLIHWAHDPNEETWLNEALSEVAMVTTGFGSDEGWMSSWLNDPSDPLMVNDMGGNYGIFLLFGTYIWERFGDGFITDVVADPGNGATSLDELLATINTPTDLATVLGDMGMAIAVNDDDASFGGGIYGYSTISPGEVDSSDLTQSAAVDETISGSGGFSFISSDVEANGLTLRLVTASPNDLEVRVAFESASGGELVTDTLTGGTTDVSLGTWPTGATLWISAANPTLSNIQLTASFI